MAQRKRAKPGRPKVYNPAEEVVTFRITSSEARQLDAMADEAPADYRARAVSRNDVARQIVRDALKARSK